MALRTAGDGRVRIDKYFVVFFDLVSSADLRSGSRRQPQKMPGKRTRRVERRERACVESWGASACNFNFPARSLVPLPFVAPPNVKLEEKGADAQKKSCLVGEGRS